MENTILVKIGGKIFSFYSEDKKVNSILHDELSIYEKQDPRVKVDMTITIGKVLIDKSKILTRNPKFVYLMDDGSFIVQKYDSTLQFSVQEDSIDILLDIRTYSNPILRYIQKFLNIEYHHRIERIGQILHENIIIPTIQFFEDVSIVHASGFKYKDGGVLISGTGGVGKTSLEIVLCSLPDISFLSDDISIIHDKFVYPNFSYPKIYAYNLENDPILKGKLMSKKGFLDKLQWKFKSLKGADKVRRRISPEVLYGKTSPNKIPFKTIITLVKSNKENLELRSVSAKEAAEFNINIIENEYSDWYNILRWVEINHQYMNINSEKYNVSNIMNGMRTKLTEAFSGGNCFILEVPLNIEHSEFKEKAKNIILNQLSKI
jgi:hypothetical protein